MHPDEKLYQRLCGLTYEQVDVPVTANVISDIVGGRGWADRVLVSSRVTSAALPNVSIIVGIPEGADIRGICNFGAAFGAPGYLRYEEYGDTIRGPLAFLASITGTLSVTFVGRK